MSNVDLRHGDCLDVLKTLDADSIDSIVTDPPYGLSFMGKGWDYQVPSVDIWAECLRVLKPGGHLLAFAGTRTQHRMCVNIEDAGFEIRDMIAWVYGSGFPKSLDVSKAIDKCNGDPNRLYKFTAWMRTTGLTARQLDKITGTCMGGHYTTQLTQPAIPTAALWELIRPHCGDVPAWVDELVQRIEAEREVVGFQARGASVNTSFMSGGNDITAPATPAAQQWEGWGTALKPALEPITVARKPFKGTVAANVLEHGTGAINIEGCRVGTEDTTIRHNSSSSSYMTGEIGSTQPVQKPYTTGSNLGRWPANLIHDGSEEPAKLLGDSARFFYTAKASKDDRDKGNTHPTVKPTDLMAYLCRLVTPPGGIVLDPFMGSGTTGKAALSEGFQFVGIERDADYFAICESRFNGAQIGLALAL